MDLIYLIGEFLEVAIPGAILIAILYGIFKLIKYGYRQIVSEIIEESDVKGNDEITNNIPKKLTYKQKKTLLDIIKVIVGAQMIGLLFYITPVINENIKIIASLVVTLGGFVGTFFIKEKIGYNGICRALIFIGQEFFGITMLLMMVNKGMGYSVNIVFGIWTAFNFYISKQFRKIENKIFFWITFIILIISMLLTYANDVDIHILIMGICGIILGIHFFCDKSKFSVKLLENISLTVLLIATCSAVFNSADNQGIIFGTIVICMLAIIFSLINTKSFNVKALFIYIPCVILLFLIEWEFDLFWFISIFNVLFICWLLSDKSIYKKCLCALFLLCLTPIVVQGADIDKMIAFIIFGSSVIFTFTYLFAPTHPINLDEGGEENE